APARRPAAPRLLSRAGAAVSGIEPARAGARVRGRAGGPGGAAAEAGAAGHERAVARPGRVGAAAPSRRRSIDRGPLRLAGADARAVARGATQEARPQARRPGARR